MIVISISLLEIPFTNCAFWAILAPNIIPVLEMIDELILSLQKITMKFSHFKMCKL